jgi:hypothetical protein
VQAKLGREMRDRIHTEPRRMLPAPGAIVRQVV